MLFAIDLRYQLKAIVSADVQTYSHSKLAVPLFPMLTRDCNSGVVESKGF
jgi:hypothetical protein